MVNAQLVVVVVVGDESWVIPFDCATVVVAVGDASWVIPFAWAAAVSGRTLWEEVLVKDVVVVVVESVICWKAKTLMLGVAVKDRQMALASELYVAVAVLEQEIFSPNAAVVLLVLVQAVGNRRRRI